MPKGAPATYDAGAPGGVLRELAASFVAGILRHLPALTALTAPSARPYLRLQPHHWSSSYTWFGDRDREASLRICPVMIGGRDPAAQFNIEYRPADATASPHLALAAISPGRARGHPREACRRRRSSAAIRRC